MPNGDNFIDNYLEYQHSVDSNDGSGYSIGYEEDGQNWRYANGAAGAPAVCLSLAIILIGFGLIIPRTNTFWLVLLGLGGLMFMLAGFFWLVNRSVRDQK